jgi:hypothetical protein
MTLFGVISERDDLGQTFSPFMLEHARDIRIQSAKEITRYCRIYRQLYGLAQIPRHILHPITSTLEILSDNLGSAETRDTFIELSQFLFASAERFRCVFGMVKGLEERVHRFRDKVPLEMVDLFEMLGRDAVQLS